MEALADYVYVHKCDWRSAKPVIESLRVDEGHLKSFDSESFDQLVGNYSSVRVRRFLEGLRRVGCYSAAGLTNFTLTRSDQAILGGEELHVVTIPQSD